ncbi:MAG: FecR domain-containing protein [Ignavibacteriaceae bacterium]
MNLKEFSILIEKYKRGECSPREKEWLENYLESFQNNPGEWNENEMGKQSITGEKIYSGIMKNIKNERTNYFIRTFQSPSLLKRAASIIFFILLGTGILYISGLFNQKESSVVWHEKVTSPGEKSVLTLSDGSIVTLNADSKLRYPDRFDDMHKEVYLEGEAYFEVRHNSNQPFIVHSENLTTTDLGTKFDVSAYRENNTISVSLLEGKVEVSGSEKGKSDKIIVLKPKEKLLYDKENNVSSFGVFDSLEVVGWKDNIYKFENEPLGEVLSRLKRAYGIEFKLSDQPVLLQKITVKFEKKSLLTVVDVIKSLTGLDYKLVKKNQDIKEVLFFRDNK